MRSKPVMLPLMRSLCRVRKRSMTVFRMRCAKNIMPETVMERLYFGCGQRPRCALFVSFFSRSKRSELALIALKVSPRLHQGVAAEFLQERFRQHHGNHGLARHARRGDNADVGALIGSLHGLLGGEVCGLQRPPQSGGGLQLAARKHVLPVRDAAFEAP